MACRSLAQLTSTGMAKNGRKMRVLRFSGGLRLRTMIEDAPGDSLYRSICCHYK